MTPNLAKLGELVGRIRTPLSLAGLAFVVLYLIYRQVLSLQIFSQLTEKSTFDLVDGIVQSLFWLALVALLLGVVAFLLSPVIRRKSGERTAELELVDASLDSKAIPRPANTLIARTDGRYRVQDLKFGQRAIDFKFVNHGNGTAVIHAFNVKVLKVDLDVSPELSFSWELSGSPERPPSARLRHRYSLEHPAPVLDVTVRNQGWGAAHDLRCAVSDSILTDLFPEESLVFTGGDVAPDSSERVLRIHADQMDPTRMAEQPHRDAWSPSLLTRMEVPITRTTPGFRSERVSKVLPVRLPLRVSYRDEKGISHTYETGDLVANADEELWINQDGFHKILAPPPMNLILPSYQAYAVVVEARPGSRKRYPISRQVGPGEAERFHIALAGRRSGRYLLRIGFKLDGRRTVTAGPIWVDLSRSRRMRIPPEFDGSTLEMDGDVVTLGYPDGQLGPYR